MEVLTVGNARRLTVDFVSGDPIPKYSLEILDRLRERIDVRSLVVRMSGSTQLHLGYQFMEHVLLTRFGRRKGSILHIDHQMLGYILAAPARPPTVLTCHDIVHLLPEFDDPSYVSRTKPIDRMYYASLKRGLRMANRIIADSNHTKQDLVRLGCDSSRIDVVYLGVDRARYRPHSREECEKVLVKHRIPVNRPIVLFVGSEHPRKNIPGLIRALPRIRDETQAILVKVGQPRHPQRQELFEMARSLGVADDIVFLDSVAEQDMPLLYGAADVLVLVSFYEGFGLPPVEAMACGTPAVVSDATSLPEVVGDAGLIVDPRDPDSVAGAVVHILADAKLRAELRTRGIERATRFGWGQTADGIIHSYQEALASAL